MTFEDRYTLLDRALGEGGFARVQLAKEIETHEPVAVKIFPLEASTMIDIRSEIGALQRLNHKNIIKILGTYEQPPEYFVVMEYIQDGSTLLDFFTQDKPAQGYEVNEENVRTIVLQVAQALQYAWTKKVVHRDVKLDNVLVRDWSTFNVVLADFNLAKEVASQEAEMRTELGSLGFKAPEIYTGEPYNFKCDIWSLGVLTYVLLSWGQMPYTVDVTEDVSQMENAMRSEFNTPWVFAPAENWDKVSKEGKDVVTKMLVMQPSGRPTYGRLLKHKWFKKNFKNLVNLNTFYG